MSRGGSEREGDTESEARSGLWAVSTDPNTEAPTHKQWDHDLSRTLTLKGPPTRPKNSYFLKYFFKSLFIYFERGRESMGREGQRQRERERQSQAGSAGSAQSLTCGSNSRNCEIMTWAGIKSRMLNQTSHPGVPQTAILNMAWSIFTFHLPQLIPRTCSGEVSWEKPGSPHIWVFEFTAFSN